jgi:hypothetical protein
LDLWDRPTPNRFGDIRSPADRLHSSGNEPKEAPPKCPNGTSELRSAMAGQSDCSEGPGFSVPISFGGGESVQYAAALGGGGRARTVGPAGGGEASDALTITARRQWPPQLQRGQPRLGGALGALKFP